MKDAATMVRRRARFWRAGFGVRQWLVMDLVWFFSVGLGRDWAVLPRRFLVSLCGVSEKHVWDVVRGLVRGGFVERQGDLYRVLAPGKREFNTEGTESAEDRKGSGSDGENETLIKELLALNLGGEKQLGIPRLEELVREGQSVIVVKDGAEAPQMRDGQGTWAGADENLPARSVAGVGAELSRPDAAVCGDLRGNGVSLGEAMRQAVEKPDEFAEPAPEAAAFCRGSRRLAVDRGKNAGFGGALLVASREKILNTSLETANRGSGVSGRGDEAEFMRRISDALGPVGMTRFGRKWRFYFRDDAEAAWGAFEEWAKVCARVKGGERDVTPIGNAGGWMQARFFENRKARV